MTQILISCQLEWDMRRGVLYVHNNETGATVLRICGLRTLKDSARLSLRLGLLSQGMIDITKPERVSYPAEN